jgi:hypothetical protein
MKYQEGRQTDSAKLISSVVTMPTLLTNKSKTQESSNSLQHLWSLATLF